MIILYFYLAFLCTWVNCVVKSPCLLSVRCEIEETLERLKQLERELSCKEQELAERERRLTEWENRLMERSRSCTPVSLHHPVFKITTHSANILLLTMYYIYCNPEGLSLRILIITILFEDTSVQSSVSDI